MAKPVLIIDDEVEIQELLIQICRKIKMDVVTANNGVEAVFKTKNQKLYRRYWTKQI